MTEIGEDELSFEDARAQAAAVLAADEHKAHPDGSGEDPRETREDALDDPALQAEG